MGDRTHLRRAPLSERIRHGACEKKSVEKDCFLIHHPWCEAGLGFNCGMCHVYLVHFNTHIFFSGGLFLPTMLTGAPREATAFRALQKFCMLGHIRVASGLASQAWTPCSWGGGLGWGTMCTPSRSRVHMHALPTKFLVSRSLVALGPLLFRF